MRTGEGAQKAPRKPLKASGRPQEAPKKIPERPQEEPRKTIRSPKEHSIIVNNRKYYRRSPHFVIFGSKE